MAKQQYIVKATVQGHAKKGDKTVVLKRSPDPQDVPSGLVKELLARGLIEEVGGKAADKPDDTGGDGGTGDGASGD